MRAILIITFFLVAAGLIMIYSASAIFAGDRFGDQYYFFKRQMMWAGIGFFMMAAASFLRLELLQKLAKPFLIITGLSLVLVLFPGVGTKIGGARRWLRFGMFSFQPAEMAKLALIIYSAGFLSMKMEVLNNFREGVLPLLIVLGAAIALILKQPDLGTAVLIGSIVLVMMFIAGVPLRYLAILGLGSAPVFALLIFKVSYRWRRILVFLNPWEDPSNTGYQITQSLIALGSGGIIGVGLGKSVQKLYYLPESFTDFIFSIIGEEAGFVGTFCILLLMAVFICNAVKISRGAANPFAYLLGMGLTVMIGLQAIIHMGVVTSCLPTKGLPLPFVSFGGSSLVVNMIAVGLLVNISRGKRPKANRSYLR